MLAPHHAEDAQLSIVWLTAEQFLNTHKFLRRDAVFINQFRGDGGIGRHLGGRRFRLRFQGVNEALENPPAIGAAQHILCGALGVWHHAGHVAGLVADSGNVCERAVGVGVVGRVALGIDVPKQDLVAGHALDRSLVIPLVNKPLFRSNLGENGVFARSACYVPLTQEDRPSVRPSGKFSKYVTITEWTPQKTETRGNIVG